MTSPSIPTNPRLDYGVDAPGLLRFFAISGITALGLATLVIWGLRSIPLLKWGVGGLLGVIGLYLSGMATLMFVWSKFVKVAGREVILDRILWRGDERVLDIGCGRGLMLIGAAKRLRTGKAIGVDIWQSKDQSGNQPDAALGNARQAGVEDRIEVATADMRTLPYADASFDVVVSHWVVHNLADAADRNRALEEMTRVLRPGGRLILADIENRSEYQTKLEQLSLLDIELVYHPITDQVLRAVSFGSFGPATHFARKPE